MKTKTLSLLLITSTFLFSCKKDDTGGDVTLVAKISHHSTPVYDAIVYVKFDAEELPSNPTSDYDLKVDGETSENHVHIEGLRYGNYYLYAVGYDSTISEAVTGGIGLKIKWSERKDEIELTIPVTEEH